jgi:hypothetical protein
MVSPVTEALGRALAASVPRSIEALAPAFESDTASANAAMADVILGPLPPRLQRGASDTEKARRAALIRERRSYMRNIQRYRRGERRARAPKERGAVERLRNRARPYFAALRLDMARRGGLLMALHVSAYRVSDTPYKARRMPAVGLVPITPKQTRPIIDIWARGNHTAAGADLLSAFNLNYWRSAEPDELDLSIDHAEVHLGVEGAM